MKHSTKEALKRFGIATACLTLVASTTLPFMGNRPLTAEELERAELLATMRDYRKEIVVPASLD